jgi:hypothetical protein
MLILQQNLYVPHGKQCTSCHEEQSCELDNKVKKHSVFDKARDLVLLIDFVS